MAEVAEDSTETAQSSKTIYVIQGSNIDEQLLWIHFESEKHEGGAIESITYDDEGGAQILFQQSEGNKSFIKFWKTV